MKHITTEDMVAITTKPESVTEAYFKMPDSRAEVARIRGRLWHYAKKQNKSVSTSVKGENFYVKVTKN